MLDAITAEPLTLRDPHQHDPGPSHAARNQGILGIPIALHRAIISPQDGDPCTFTPSCSEYALEALRTYGAAGWVLASDRLLRCHGGNERDYASVDGHKIDPVTPIASAARIDGLKALRGALLSIVPGLGHFTAGKWSDGIYALATVGVLGAGAAAYLSRDQHIPALLAGSVTTFFYAGNIYGGAMAHGRRIP